MTLFTFLLSAAAPVLLFLSFSFLGSLSFVVHSLVVAESCLFWCPDARGRVLFWFAANRGRMIDVDLGLSGPLRAHWFPHVFCMFLGGFMRSWFRCGPVGIIR